MDERRDNAKVGEVAASEELHRQIFERSRAVQLLIDPASGRIVDANTAACRFYGYRREDLLSRSISDINTLPATEVQQCMNLAATERRDVFFFCHRLASGELRDVEVRSGPVEVAGRRLLYSVVHDVTDRKQTEEALRQTEERYRSIVESLEDGFYEVDLRGRFTLANDALARILACQQREDLIGASYQEFTDEDNARKVRGAFLRALQSGEPATSLEWEVRRRDGAHVHVGASISLVRDLQGRPMGYRGVVRDVTGRKRSEAVQAALYRIAEITSSFESMEAFYKAIHGVVGELMYARNFYIALHDEPSGVLEFPYFVDEVDAQPGPIPPGKSLTGYVLRKGHPLLCSPTVFADLVAQGEIELMGGPSLDWLGVPLMRGERPFGVLVVQSYTESVRYAEADKSLLTFVSQHVATAIDRRQAADALRDSEEKFRTLAETTPCAIFIYQGTRFCYANAAMERISGYEREEFLGMDFWDTVHPEFRDLVRERGLARQRGENVPSSYEFKFIRKDGEVRWLEFSAGSIIYDGKPAALGTAFDITERKAAEEQIKSLAYHDALTGLPNRLLFNDRLSIAIAQSHRHGQRLSVLFLDLDRFKVINDSLGHTLGDRLLQAVAGRLLSSVREGDTVARLGGDEFTLLLPGVSRAVDVAKVAEKVQESLRRPFRLDERELFVTSSMGISLYPDDGEDVESLVKNADIAMYRAKEQGRDTYQLYTAAMNATALERLALENNLRKALAQNELVVYYQPLLDIASGRVHGLEALLRWRHPDLGLVSPSEFIPLAEITGLIFPMGPWILKTACAQTKAWHDAGHSHLSVAVNLSARQFQQQDLVAQVTRVLEETGLPPRFLDLEITESNAMQSFEATIQTLRELKALGVKISIDDFGIGYSSLSYLKRLPLDTLKIDQSFVRDISTDPDDATIITAVIAMAHTLKLAVVAEGVETEEQLAFLAARRCDRMQGYLFSHPLPAQECEELLDRHRS